MNALNYLLQVNVYLLLFYLFYLALLRNETFFKLNRFYLMITSLISLFVPLLQSDWIRSFFITEQVYQVTQNAAAIVIYDTGNALKAKPGWKVEDILWVVYLTGVFISLLLFIRKLYAVHTAIQKSTAKQAFSFFKTIVVDPSLPQKETIEQHELVHAKQWHSADVLFFEFLGVINWFNPVIYGIKKAVKNIHEFIADEKASSHEKSKADYALILLNSSFGVPQYQLTNSFFNQSLLKKRILMLHKEKSRRAAILKYGLSAPLFAGMLIFSSAMAAPAGIAAEIKSGVRQIAGVNAEGFQPGVSTESLADTIQPPPPPPVADLGKPYKAYIQRNIRYPRQDREHSNIGIVVCTFSIDASGKVVQPNIAESFSEESGNEVLRVFNNAPSFSAGLKGKYLQVIRFGLAGENETVTSSESVDFSKYSGFSPLKEIVVIGFGNNSKASSGNTTKENPVNFASIDVLPQFPGGQPGWAAYLSENLNYPKEAKDKNIQGRVTVQFIVEKDGSLTEPMVLRGIGSGCDEEAIRVLKESPNWKPGMQNGKPVRVSYVMPIVFSLGNNGIAKTDTAKSILNISSTQPPLFILDGKEIKREEVRKLDRNEINAINVLKDKSAVEKYGEKGKNGVVEIITKKEK